MLLVNRAALFWGMLALWGMSCVDFSSEGSGNERASDGQKEISNTAFIDVSKNLSFSQVGSEKLSVEWEPITTDAAAAASVTYQVYSSLIDNISGVSSMKANGTLQGETTGITTFTLSALSSSSMYFINVMAIESVAVESAYNSAPVVTENSGIEDLAFNMKIDANLENNRLFSMVLDSEGNLYTAGYGMNIFSASSGGDGWVKKFSPAGLEDVSGWNKVFDFSVVDIIEEIEAGPDDEIYVAGYGLNLYDNFSDFDIWIKKFSKDGIEISAGWNKVIHLGSDANFIRDIVTDSEGNLYAGGYARNLVSASSNNDGWIKKFFSTGVEDAAWDKKIDLGGGSNDVVQALAVDVAGNLYVAGYSDNLVSENSGVDVFIKKYDPDGVEDLLFWNKAFDMNSSSDMPSALAVDSGGNLYYGGYSQNQVSANSKLDWVIKKFTASGLEVVAWSKVFDRNGGDDLLHSIVLSKNNHLYVAGSGSASSSGGSYDWWIKKFNPGAVEDTINWNQAIGTVDADTPYAIVINEFHELYIGGDGSNLVLANSKSDWWVKKFR